MNTLEQLLQLRIEKEEARAEKEIAYNNAKREYTKIMGQYVYKEGMSKPKAEGKVLLEHTEIYDNYVDTKNEFVKADSENKVASARYYYMKHGLDNGTMIDIEASSLGSYE